MGDHLLSGSDGFFNYVKINSITNLLMHETTIKAQDLAAFAKNNAGKYSDDISLVYVRVKPCFML